MKFNKIMIAALAATTLLASCNKVNETEKNDKGQSAKLVVNVKAPATKASSTVAPTVTDDTTITNYTVFVFNDLGILEQRTDGTTASIEVTGITTKATDVYVLANAGAGSTAVPTTVNTKAKLEAWVGDLNGSASQTASRWAAGKNATAIAFVASGADNLATTSVTLKFVAARITVAIEPMTDYDNTKTDNSLILKSVSILNAGGATKLYGSSLIPSATELTAAAFAGKTRYAGISMTGMGNAPAAADYSVVSFLTDDISALNKADFAGKYFYHYSFENNAATPADFPVIVLIEGEYAGGTVYFPVHLASYQEFTTGALATGVERGNSYDLVIKLTGQAGIAGGGDTGETGGETDPTDEPAATAKLTVSLSIGSWTPTTLVKEF